MPLPPFDVLVKMTDTELDAIAQTEFERLLSTVDAHSHQRYRAIWNGCKLRSMAAKNPIDRMLVASDAMHEKFSELNAALQDITRD